MAYATRATFYGNYYLLISTFPNISLLIKHLTKDIIFKQRLEKSVGIKTTLCDVFGEIITNISSGVVRENYLNCIRGNWQNVNI